MARIVADALGGELDAVPVRKLRAPGQPELAIGAADEAGTVLEGECFRVADVEDFPEVTDDIVVTALSRAA